MKTTMPEAAGWGARELEVVVVFFFFFVLGLERPCTSFSS